MYDLSQLQGLFGGGAQQAPFLGGGPPPHASQLPGVTQMPQFGRTPLQGMGLQSPFMTERPQQALPTQGFMPTRDNAMGSNAMSMMGMNPNMPNMVGPTSALPTGMQPQASQLKMWGMENQQAPPSQSQPGSGQTQPGQQPDYVTQYVNSQLKQDVAPYRYDTNLLLNAFPNGMFNMNDQADQLKYMNFINGLQNTIGWGGDGG